MKAKQLPSLNWRAQYNTYEKKANGKGYKYGSVTMPTEKEAIFAALELELKYKQTIRNPSKITLGEAIDKYIATTCNILSPTTIQAYKKIRKFAFQDIMSIPINKLTTDKLKESVNLESSRIVIKGNKISPKTVRNEYGLISGVLREYKANIDFNAIKLPAKHKIIKDLIHPEIIYNIVKGTDIELPVLLAMWLSFSMSEIRGLTKSGSINGDYITIRETIVDIDGKPIEKDGAKEFERVRRHKIPKYIKKLIDSVDGDKLVILNGRTIYDRWIKLLKKNNLPVMSFHGLRHVNASVMLKLKVPDKYAMERGGWKTPDVMKNVYQQTFDDERLAVDNSIDNYFENIINDKNNIKKLQLKSRKRVKIKVKSHELSHIK